MIFLGFANIKKWLVEECEIFSASFRESIRKISKKVFTFLSLSEKNGMYYLFLTFPKLKLISSYKRVLCQFSKLNA